jgi:hypothetical protein
MASPVLVAPGGAIVAFAAGTHVFCLRLPRQEVDPRLVGERKEKLSDQTVLRTKQLQLDELVERAWSRIDPWTVDVPKDEGLTALADLVHRAVEATR